LVDLTQPLALAIGDQQPRGVGADVDAGVAHGSARY
jgi:hypothetical protein